MGRPEEQLRVYQVICVLFVAACILLSRSLVPEAEHASSAVQFFVILVAVWSAFSGFRLQRLLARDRSNSVQRSTTRKKSTPFTRWRAGHLMRLVSATSVALWGFVLFYLGGSTWLVDALFGSGLVLLLIWSPGSSPESTGLEP
jgi:hypothetical protein